MEYQAFKALLTPDGQAVLQAADQIAPRRADFLGAYTHLCRRFPPELARAALETAILRREAADKFPFAGQMYFTREALEQASGWEVANYRAERYRPFQLLADLGCSIGGDTLALARLSHTLGIDCDPLRLAMAQANAGIPTLRDQIALGGVEFIQADLTSSLPLKQNPGLGLFFDPARRRDGRRIYTVHDYRPSLDVVKEWLPSYPTLGVKVSPGVRLAELSTFEAEVEFISHQGALKEATLWFGPLKTAPRRATLLPGPHTLAPGGESSLETSKPRAILYEPDPAVLRAGLVAELGQTLGAAQLDPDIAYLTADRLTPTPFARAWPIEAWFPFNLKRLRAYLRERRVGEVVVKKRGSPLQPESLRQALRLKPSSDGCPERRLVVLTHLRGRPIVVICFPGD